MKYIHFSSMMADIYDIPAYCQSAINHEQKSAFVFQNTAS